MRKRFLTTIDTRIIHAIKVQAVKESTNVNNILERLILEYLKVKSVEELEESK